MINQNPSPSRQSALDRFLQSFQRWSFRARFLTVSLLVHMIVVILGGGVVLFRAVTDPPDFEGSAAGVMGEDVGAPAPDERSTELTSEPTLPVTAMVTAPVVEAITSSVTTSSFTLSTSAPSAKLGSGDSGNMSKMLGKGGGAGVGTGKIGGTMRFFGSKEKVTNALVGTFYDLKQTRNRKETGVTPDQFHRIFRDFVEDGWRASSLAKYFRSPNRLYATQIFIPNMSADEGPKAFEMQKEVQPSRWLVHYQGSVSPPVDGKYHFVGGGDDVMIVRFNGKVVLDRCWEQRDEQWHAPQNYDYGYTGIPNGFARGDAVEVRVGEYYDIEILIGEQPGSLVFFSLLIEQEGVEYQKDAKGNPILPVFRLADIAVPDAQPGQTFPPYQPNGPVWKAANVERNKGGMGGFDDFFKK